MYLRIAVSETAPTVCGVRMEPNEPVSAAEILPLKQSSVVNGATRTGPLSECSLLVFSGVEPKRIAALQFHIGCIGRLVHCVNEFPPSAELLSLPAKLEAPSFRAGRYHLSHRNFRYYRSDQDNRQAPLLCFDNRHISTNARKIQDAN